MNVERSIQLVVVVRSFILFSFFPNPQMPQSLQLLLPLGWNDVIKTNKYIKISNIYQVSQGFPGQVSPSV